MFKLKILIIAVILLILNPIKITAPQVFTESLTVNLPKFESKPAVLELETVKKPKFTNKEIELLEKLAWCEAGGEDLKAQILIVNVVLNRVDSDLYADDIISVIYEKNQFCPVRTGFIDCAEPSNVTKNAVEMALNGTDYSQSALSFNTIELKYTSYSGRNFTWLFDYSGISFYR